MHFTTFLISAILSTPAVLAAPRAEAAAAAEPDPLLGLDLGLGNLVKKILPQKCPGNSYWVGWYKSCKCENSQYYSYDQSTNKCQPPKYSYDNCGNNENYYCASSYDNYGKYDASKSYCDKNDYTVSFCSKKDDVYKKLNQYCPPKKSKNCYAPRSYNWYTNKCECKDGKVYHGGKCVYKPYPKPYCGGNKKPYCAKNEYQYTPYSQWHEYCGDDGTNYVFCTENPKEYCQKKWYYSS